jgi:peptidoglycan/LPS O-acetylase OafA/YrhL
MSAVQKTVSHSRIFGFDLLRSIAIILVMITHTLALLNVPRSLNNKIFNLTGLLGVELFFLLSGFLIGTILIKEFNNRAGFDFNTIKGFWIRRWFRTLPNYYLMFFVYAVFFYFGEHIIVLAHPKYLAYLVFLQNTFTAHPTDFYIVAWSLSIEEWFYLSFPLVLLIVGGLIPNNKFKAFFITIIVFIITCLVLRLIAATMFNPDWDEGIRKIMPLRLDSIAFGVLCAFVTFYYPKVLERHKTLFFLLGLIFLCVLMLMFYWGYIVQVSETTLKSTRHINIFFSTFFFTLTSLSIALIIPFLNYVKTCRNKILLKIVTIVSEISYSIYLVHFIIIKILDRMFKTHGPYEFILVWIFTFVLSYFQFHYFEIKVTKLRDGFKISKAE